MLRSNNKQRQLITYILIFFGCYITYSSGATGDIEQNLPTTFLRLWNEETANEAGNASLNPTRKITSLFMKSEENANIKLTMLIAYSPAITNSLQNLLQYKVNPLIFSVSALPLESTEFKPEELTFIQSGRTWRPGRSADSTDIFALGQQRQFGGIVHDAQIHQGVILLPGWFDLNQPIQVTFPGHTERTSLIFR